MTITHEQDVSRSATAAELTARVPQRRPGLDKAASTCFMSSTSKRRRRADTGLNGGTQKPRLLRRGSSNSSSRAYSHDEGILESLDLNIPLNRRMERLKSLLDGSISEAMEKLQCLKEELSTDDDSSDDSTAINTANYEHLDYPTPNSLKSSASSYGSLVEDDRPIASSNIESNKEDVETLQAFLDDVYNLLSSIQRDVREQLASLSLPSMPSMPSMPAMPSSMQVSMPSTFDKKAVIDSLHSNYEKAQEVFFQLSLYSPLSINLPEFPSSLAMLSSAAKGALAAASGTSTPVSSSTGGPTSPSLATDGAFPTNPLSSRSPTPSASPANTFTIPQPPLGALRAFLSSESARLSAKLPHPRAPTLDDWDYYISQNVQTALNEASTLLHDETEKIKEFVADEAEKLRQALSYGQERLLHFHELPESWRNNKYILSGYRFIPIDRPGELLLSAFRWHNETVNIYTHFIPAAYIIYYIFFVFPHTPLGDTSLNTFYDRSANLAFLLAALACLILSAAWHLAAGCGTFSVFHGCATLDYLGISALISTSIISLTHAAFRCDPAIDLVYNMTTGIFGILGLYLPWKPWFNDRAHKNVRIAFFVLLAAVGAAPIIHMGCLYGFQPTWHFYSPVLYSILAYKIGLLFYATDFPEALRPGGIFDTLAHSHQFWHCAIVVAIALHWSALKGMNEAGLEGYSCLGRDPHKVQYFSRWLSHIRDEL